MTQTHGRGARGACLCRHRRPFRLVQRRPRRDLDPPEQPLRHVSGGRASGRSPAIPRRPSACSPAPTWACSAGTSRRRDGCNCRRRCRMCGRSPSIRPNPDALIAGTRPAGFYPLDRRRPDLDVADGAGRHPALRRQRGPDPGHADSVRSGGRRYGLGAPSRSAASIAARIAA